MFLHFDWKRNVYQLTRNIGQPNPAPVRTFPSPLNYWTIITPWGLNRLPCYNLCKSDIQASQKRDAQVGNTVPTAMKMPLTYFWTALHWINHLYVDIDSRPKFSNLKKKEKNKWISNVHCHIWMQHEKCIKMSTNKPSIGAVALDSLLKFEEKKQISTFSDTHLKPACKTLTLCV